MGKFRDAFDAGRDRETQTLSNLETLVDPVGRNEDHARLRALGKWRFILLRGAIGFGIPMFLWSVLSNLRPSLKSAALWHEPIKHLLQSWLAGLLWSALIGIIVGFLAWRRLTSDSWPGAEPNPESSFTRLGSLRER